MQFPPLSPLEPITQPYIKEKKYLLCLCLKICDVFTVQWNLYSISYKFSYTQTPSNIISALERILRQFFFFFKKSLYLISLNYMSLSANNGVFNQMSSQWIIIYGLIYWVPTTLGAKNPILALWKIKVWLNQEPCVFASSPAFIYYPFNLIFLENS